jgi:hypothetical protein
MKKIFLHIGTGKTGTSSIQNFLNQHQDLLRMQHKVLYPNTGLVHSQHFGEVIHAHYDLPGWIAKRHHEPLQILLNEISTASCDTVIISCENLYHNLVESDLVFLRELLTDFEVHVVCYVRRQDLYMESAWKQQVKVGAMRMPFEQFLERHTDARFLHEVHANYYRMLRIWANVWGQEHLRVRVFDPSAWPHRDLIHDFAVACDLGDEVAVLPQPAVTNVAMPSELMRLISKINALRLVEGGRQEDLVAWLRGIRTFANTPLLTQADRQAILKNYHESNQQLFQELCGARVPACFSLQASDVAPKQPVARKPLVEDISVRTLIAAWQLPVVAQSVGRAAEQVSSQGDSHPAVEDISSLKDVLQGLGWDVVPRAKKSPSMTKSLQWHNADVSHKDTRRLTEILHAQGAVNVLNECVGLVRHLPRLTKIELHPHTPFSQSAQNSSVIWARFEKGSYALWVDPKAPRLSDLLMRVFPICSFFEQFAHQYPDAVGQLPVLVLSDPRIEGPILVFYGYKPGNLLIPDSYFVRANGYSEFNQNLQSNWIDWQERQPIAYWRDALIGSKRTESHWQDLPRAQFVQRAAEIPGVTAKIDQITGFSDPLVLEEINQSGWLVSSTAPADGQKYRYLLDYDSASSSYPGLFQRLLTGSVVLKIDSPQGHRQWYYDQLEPWKNFIPVKPDLSDLEKKIAYLRAHDDEAREIGRRGRELALSLTPESVRPGVMKTLICAWNLNNPACLLTAPAATEL